MKFLKKLTKVVSVVLAAVSVFSVGIPASALGDKQGIIKSYKGACYTIEERRGGAVALLDADGKAAYGICWNPAISRYRFLNIKTRQCECSTSAQRCGLSYTINQSDSDRFLGNFGRSDRSKQNWIAGGEFSCGRAIFESLRGTKPTDPDTRGTYGTGASEYAKLYTKGFSAHMNCIIMFLAVMSSALGLLGKHWAA